MRFAYRMRWLAALTGVAVCLVSCARFAWWRDVPVTPETGQESVLQQLKDVDHRALLENKVRESIGDTPTTADKSRGRLVRRKPYFFKQYFVYPEGIEGAKMEITGTESRSTSYVARIEIPKVRFATRMHRDKDEARDDDDYLRQTGTETITYEFRHGRWQRVGSLFLVSKTEENVNGEWLPLEQEVLHAIAKEEQEKKGWFSRTWSRLTGWW